MWLGMSRLVTYLPICITMVLIFCSWWMLVQMAKGIRGVSFAARIARECCSVALGIAAYAVLFLPVTFRWVGASSLMQRRNLWNAFLLASIVVAVIHFFIHLTISARHRQTQELMLIFFRILADSVMLCSGCAIVLGPACRVFQCFWGSKRHGEKDELRSRRLPFWRMRIILIGGVLALMLFVPIIPLFLPGDAKRLLEVGMLGDRVDFCGLEGLALSRAAATGWVLPEYTHRRLLNAFGGSDQCGTNTISFLDEEEEVLVVFPLCPDGKEQPRVYIERPERSELNGGTEVLPKVLNMSKVWHQTLEMRYGTNETVHQSMGVHVTRDPAGVIQSVEVIPSRLIPVSRKPRSDYERIARAGWSSSKVWEVPLGESGAYSVHCPTSDYEEYHVFPPVRCRKAAAGEKVFEGKGRDDAGPPASVLVLVLDAVSRAEVQRSLPKFRNWLRNFRSNRSSKHVFVEAQGATTISHSTDANLVPLFTGNILSRVRGRKSEIAERSLFRLAKQKYGSRFSTSYTIGDCMDVMLSLFGGTKDSAGFGEPYGNDLDYNTFGPFCHIQYSALEGNFQGANSILRRCIGQQYVHEYVLNYTRALVRRRLRRRRQENQQTQAMSPSQNASVPLQDDAVFFLDVLHLLEGHEGTHGVVYLVDDALTAFLDDLQKRLGFFDDPSNALLLLSDHGNHMGPYYELTAPGQLERALPFAGFILHRELLSRMDRIKGYAAGLSLSNMMQRTRRISTTLDLHMTLADLLGVEAKVPRTLRNLAVLPSSLFDARDVPSRLERCSELGALDSKRSGCFLMWCEKK
ncbi:putative transmembrane protein [Trypanosoma conorhini]|uniref:Putative transmembrane protein n=1 Tax=Trypanosoma conorhini TaxID=83891 RepID=A0A3R7NHX6_9TRYP|nr:putative transmembrane protein [Trypanosoma conorhini]RNF22351.1 putative transmembrane protein [Trypanosoma conorhini]